ncbi:MAG TPA: chromosome segregation protein SMC [Acidimicrobiales bacterium]|nr:chromosome segregation protein SMC [Acidimicrobiales bacterium]
MFLKSLTLKGFKSFADTTTLEFEPGITVVVGPNGSGKSNVVDAVAWVLGAQGPRTVRSSKMEDVIFAGSAKRPALGRAEVTLTIDNSAGLIPVEFAEVSITRTLFRSGDSEYAINNVPCRLLDVQELLSDTGVGRQQHVIVSQGQLDAVLNARPEDRRLIIEEAAGVLKFRRRREKAQRRLDATEGNLLRLQDLLREVRRQLRPLERQADAARRHGQVQADLHALKLHLSGREVAGLQSRLRTIAATRAELAQAEGSLRTALSRLDGDIAVAEAALSAQGGEDLGDAMVRLEGLRERARGIVAVLRERARSVEREQRASVDAGVVASLEAEASHLAGELEQVVADIAGLGPADAELTEAESTVAAEREAFDAEWGEAPGPGGPAQAAEVRAELSGLRAAVERLRVEQGRVAARRALLAEGQARLDADLDRLRGELAAATDDETPLLAVADQADASRRDAGDQLAAAEARLREAEQDAHAWTARAEALALAIDELRARAGAERLAGVDGVLGTLLELVEIDADWGPAFEAAVGPALAAVVVESGTAGRAALTLLTESDAAGAVLPAGGRTAPGPDAPSGTERVRTHVRARRPEVDALLDRLLATAVAVGGGWSAGVDVAMAHPDLVVVTMAGDRFGPDGWRIGHHGAGATGAALEEARARAAATSEAAAAERETVEEARGRLSDAEAAAAEAAAALDANDARIAAATEGVQRTEAERRSLAAEDDALAPHDEELAAALATEQGRVDELEGRLPDLEAEEAAGAERRGAWRSSHDRLEQAAADVARRRTELQVRAAGLDERQDLLRRRLAEIDERLGATAGERADAAAHRDALDRVATAIGRLDAQVGGRLSEVEAELERLRDRRRRHGEQVRAAAERLDVLRRERATAEKQLAELRERSQRAEIEEAEVKLRLETATETIRRELEVEPDVAVAAPLPELPPGTSADTRARELERDLRLMGPINPLALEEFTALSERHEFLEGQLEDVKASRRELGKVIRAIDTDIVEVFNAAYADVADNFVRLFTTLFPGGTGRLRLTDPDNPLETGIEVEARPSGKNVKRLSLLSGGERSLTALAFLFAVFRSRPSPFYLLDEVEAALDDVNLHRFLDLLHEFREEAQLVVVSHQKRTMEAADSLYGVTMQPGGSSKVVSERVNV